MNSNRSLLDLLFNTNSETEVRLSDYTLPPLGIHGGHPAFEFDIAYRITEETAFRIFDKIYEYLESIHWKPELLNSGLDAFVERFFNLIDFALISSSHARF
ncbi:hypothetical protein HHI36_014494 [Cryptolaemus montrouzieri]|uniref:Uncharacterized protein n=1 Tax=Cryptolaemus montrouzieri TaxID=559131 RepID=A0ABD2N360_9CUCU